MTSTPLYRCQLIDPPWPERGGGKCKRGADRHYNVMGVKKICETLHDSWQWNPDPAGSHLWLWTPDNQLPDALWLMERLKFRYVRTAVWVKDRFGLGQYLRGQHELLLFGVRGKLPALVRNRSSVVHAKRREHSRKPDEAYDLIEAVSPGPRIEFFARTCRPGWHVFGDETDRFIECGHFMTRVDTAAGTLVCHVCGKTLGPAHPVALERARGATV